MRILHLLCNKNLPADPDRAPLSGVVRATLEIARVQAQRGHDVEVVTTNDRAWQATWQGVQLSSLASVRGADLRIGKRRLNFAKHLPFVIKTHRETFDVVHGHAYEYLRFIRARARVVHVHTDPQHPSTGFRAADYQSIARFSDAQIAISHYVASHLRAGLAERGNVHMIHNGLPVLARPDDLAAARLELRQRLGISEDDTVILFAGAVKPEKGVEYLARAFACLAATTPSAHLVIAGSSLLWGHHSVAPDSYRLSDYESLVHATLIQSEEVRRRTHFLGNVASHQMSTLYAAADVLVVPSVWQEPFGLVPLEAMSLGLPVIASRVGGLPEVIGDSGGLLVAPKDAEALLEAMRDLCQNSALRRTLGEQARHHASTFRWDDAADAMISLYTSVLNQRG